MGTGSDAALAVVVLVAAGVAFVLVDASPSLSATAVGGLGAIAFEIVAARDVATVRHYWDRAAVQGLSLALALLVIVIGALVAPETVLSLCCGGAITYLAFLALVQSGLVPPPRAWW
ncbi:hypothetical protein D8Y22_16470 [Salinadaptatus halalkaliphilus]|uniref:Uncharacterized protein n=1 Tax=Salinadaptatus halalkaliphilus TaxID=2419781 RepID=A0A4S3TL02_9EURY|nr:hypothetical protein [Salinadaptatus halalkaliphilus]THE63913.1 hypothetical protein D8Y22_16470 [Salinadaptatus halalkaliphilus]